MQSAEAQQGGTTSPSICLDHRGKRVSGRDIINLGSRLLYYIKGLQAELCFTFERFHCNPVTPDIFGVEIKILGAAAQPLGAKIEILGVVAQPLAWRGALAQR